MHMLLLLKHGSDIRPSAAGFFSEVKTCKDDFVCPRGFMNRGDKECRGKCDQRECCEKGEYLHDGMPTAVIDSSSIVSREVC